MGLRSALSLCLGALAALHANALTIREPRPTTSLGQGLYIDHGALDPYRAVTTPAPVGPHAAYASTGDFTVIFSNAASIPVSLLYMSNAGAPAPLGGIATTGGLGPSATTSVVFPTGWAGAVVVGTSSPVNVNGSRFEASFDEPASAPIPAYDISYVNGFSAPMVCGCNGQVVTGCNLPLFKENTCPNPADGGVCLNPARGSPNGPPTAFFAPCRGAAFTYPDDTGANTDCAEHTIKCCIGPKCPADPKQPSS